MKKVLILVFVFLLVYEASAVSSDLKDVYQPKETIIGILSGEILNTLSKSNINLVKDGHIDVAFEYDIKKINREYYLWLIAPQNKGNYTLIIKDIITNINNAYKIIKYEKNFSIEGNLSEYSIRPGFIFSDKDFEITATLYEDFDKTIDVNFPEQRQIVLNPGDNKIYFSISEVIGRQFMTISFGKYNLPAYIIGKAIIINGTNATEQNNSINDSNFTFGNFSNFTINDSIVQQKFRFKPEIIYSTILHSDKPLYPFEIINLGERTININLDYDKDKFIILPNENISIEPNKTTNFNLTLKNITKNMRDAIIAYSEDYYSYLLFEVNFTENKSEVGTNYFKGDSEKPSLYDCYELKGISCTAGEICDGNIVSSRDSNTCCLGLCKKESKSKAWIGYLIAAIIILVLFVVYSKYKKVRPIKNPIEKSVFDIEKKSL